MDIAGSLQKSLSKSENKSKRLSKELDIIKTQKDFLENQLEYSVKKAQKQEMLIRNLKVRQDNTEKQLMKSERELKDAYLEGLIPNSHISKDVYETGGQSHLLTSNQNFTNKSKVRSPQIVVCLKSLQKQLHDLLTGLEKRFGTKDTSEILQKIDDMISSIKLIPNLQSTFLSVMDIIKANNSIHYGNFFILFSS